MKKYIAKTQQFLTDHAEAITAGVAATTFTALTMYILAAKDVDAVRVIGAGKKFDDDGNLLVKVWLSNGSWSEYIWEYPVK